MRRIALLLILLVVCACSDAQPVSKGPGEGFVEGYTWHKLTRKPLPSVWVAVGVGNIPHFCPTTRDDYVVFACAYPDYPDNECVIYAEMPRGETPAWLVRHEEWHCDGWDHDDP